MVAVVQLFSGAALGYAGLSVMIERGEIGVVGLVACFFSLALILKGATRLVLSLAGQGGEGPR